MNHQLTVSDTQNLMKILSPFCNEKKLSIIQYIRKAKFATAKTLQEQCGITQPTCSRYLQSLFTGNLIIRTKVGATIIYEINQATWELLTDTLGEL